MGKKQGEIEVLIHEGRYNIVAITEMQWDETHNWNILLEIYKLLKKTTDPTKEEGELYYKESLNLHKNTQHQG